MLNAKAVIRNTGVTAVIACALASILACIVGVPDISFSAQLGARLGKTSNGLVTANIFAMILSWYIE